MNFDENLFFVVLGMILIGVEVVLGAATGFELLILGIILIMSGGVGYATGSFLITLTLATFLVFSYIIFGRKKLKDYLVLKTHNTNVDSIIGEKALVTEDIDHGKVGQVEIDGEVWRAESESKCKAGSQVKILSVSGVTLTVEPLN